MPSGLPCLLELVYGFNFKANDVCGAWYILFISPGEGTPIREDGMQLPCNWPIILTFSGSVGYIFMPS